MQQSIINDEVTRWHNTAAEQLPLSPEMTYTVNATSGRARGLTLAADRIALLLDPRPEAFSSLFGGDYILGALVAHEGHHTVRGYFKGQPDEPILLTAITEGLADVFAGEVRQGGLRPVQANRLAAARAGLRLGAALGEAAWSYEAWFSRSPCTGYDMGQLLVEHILERLPQESAASLVLVPSRKLMESANLPELMG